MRGEQRSKAQGATAGAGPLPGVPPVRGWSRAELLLAGLLLVLAAAGWWLAGVLSTPGMRSGVLTGAEPMGGPMRPWPVEAGLFFLTWTVMMAAMMLPSIVPFTVGITRLMRLHGCRGAVVTMTLAYLAVWVATGILAYPLLLGLQAVSSGPTVAAVRVGAVALAAAGAYQFTPLKRVCLRHCRSPLFLVMRHGQRATQGWLAAFRVGIGHGAYCLGCCWALFVVLLALGVMNLAWMGAVAAVVALEKVSWHGEAVGRVLGVLLAAAGLVLLAAPGMLAAAGH